MLLFWIQFPKLCLFQYPTLQNENSDEIDQDAKEDDEQQQQLDEEINQHHQYQFLISRRRFTESDAKKSRDYLLPIKQRRIQTV